MRTGPTTRLLASAVVLCAVSGCGPAHKSASACAAPRKALATYEAQEKQDSQNAAATASDDHNAATLIVTYKVCFDPQSVVNAETYLEKHPEPNLD